MFSNIWTRIGHYNSVRIFALYWAHFRCFFSDMADYVKKTEQKPMENKKTAESMNVQNR